MPVPDLVRFDERGLVGSSRRHLSVNAHQDQKFNSVLNSGQCRSKVSGPVERDRHARGSIGHAIEVFVLDRQNLVSER